MEIGLNAHRVNQSIVYSAMDTLKNHDPLLLKLER